MFSVLLPSSKSTSFVPFLKVIFSNKAPALIAAKISGSFSAVRAQSNGIGHVYNANARTQSSITAEVVDTPNTTDEVRYKIYMKSVNGTSVEIPGTTTEAATFTATEIKV